MTYETFIQELPASQPAITDAAAQSAAARSVLSAISARFPGLQRLMQVSLADVANNETRINEAVRLLSTNSPMAMQQAIAVLSGLPAESASYA